jgi:hypothetical protein
VQGIEEVLGLWEAEAAEMAGMVMEMEKQHVSSVFFQRLNLKRKQRGLMEMAPTPSTGRMTSAARSIRTSGAGFMNKVGSVFSRKGDTSAKESEGGGLGTTAGARTRPRPPPRQQGTAGKAVGEVVRPSSQRNGSKGPSFAGKAARGGSSREVFVPPQAKNVSFVQHIPKWGALPMAVVCVSCSSRLSLRSLYTLSKDPAQKALDS